MNTATISVVIGRLLVAGICAAASGYLAFNGKDGWGWFLVATIILGAITVSDSETEVKE